MPPLVRLFAGAAGAGRAPTYRYVTAYSRRAYAARSAPPPPPRYQKRPSPEPVDPDLPVGDASQSSGATTRRGPGVGAYVFGAFAAGLGFYTLQLYLAASKPCHNPHIADLAHQKDVASRYDYTAESFDSEVGFSELLMGINGTRRKLASACRGDVLEVSCGTGRNLGYYDIERKDGKVDSLSFIDLSPQMVDVCRKKFVALFGDAAAQSRLKAGLQVRFLTGSALDNMPLAPSGKKYDTVFQTMGLCSTASPTELLVNMAKHLDTSNPDARILLLEHGRSYLPWMNNILDNSAEKHADLHGCWFNRNIGALVEEAAAKSGLEVVRERRHHFGTTWLFELKPTEVAVKNSTPRRSDTALAAIKEQSEEKPTSGWLSKLWWS